MNYKTLKAAIPSNVAEIIPTYSHKVNTKDMAVIKNSESAVTVVRPFFWMPELREEFKAILLNRANKVIGVVNVSIGDQTSCVCDLPLILSLACTCRAAGVILAQNHPSDNPEPSNADKNITDRMKNALKFVNIELLDHLILTSDSYLSFKDSGLL